MLDLEKGYFVVTDGHSFEEVVSWADMHALEPESDNIYFSTCGRAYVLKVQDNEDLSIRTGVDHDDLLNGTQAIGRISYDLLGMKTCVLVHPYFVKGEGM